MPSYSPFCAISNFLAPKTPDSSARPRTRETRRRNLLSDTNQLTSSSQPLVRSQLGRALLQVVVELVAGSGISCRRCATLRHKHRSARLFPRNRALAAERIGCAEWHRGLFCRKTTACAFIGTLAMRSAASARSWKRRGDRCYGEVWRNRRHEIPDGDQLDDYLEQRAAKVENRTRG